jgi:hypothetical protein
MLLAGTAAQAATFTVTRFDDTKANVSYTNPSDGLGTGAAGDLRYELLAAMAAGGTNTVSFQGCTVASPCTIPLNGPLPPIFELTTNTGATAAASFNLTIDGGAEGAVILDGNSAAGGTNRVFFVDNVAVTLKNLVIQNATAQGGNGGGGGRAGFGAGLLVNQGSARVSVQNVSFLNCSVVGGNGGTGGAGGGMGFAGEISSGGGGGGISGPGLNGNGGAGGGGGGGVGEFGLTIGGIGGSAYAANNPGGSYGGNGGFGGGGGATYGAESGGSNGGFGGGGGTGRANGSGAGGFGGGVGWGDGSGEVVGGVQGGAGSGSDTGSGGGAAAGPAIFVVSGSITLSNVMGSAFAATPGAPGTSTAGPGTASTAPIFNYAGTVNGSTTVGGLQGVLPVGGSSTQTVYGGTPVGQTSAVQTASLLFAVDGTPSAINVLTQAAPNLDFKLASGGTCSTSAAYTAGTLCTVNFTFAPLHPGLRMGGVTLTDASGNVLASAYISGLGTGPQVAFNAASTAVTTLGGGFTFPKGGAVDGAGNVYVADGSNAAVYEIPAGCASASCVLTLGGGFTSPGSVAVDGVGNVYIVDGSAIESMPQGCASASCVTQIGSVTGGSFLAVDMAGNLFTNGDVPPLGQSPAEIPAGCTNRACYVFLNPHLGASATYYQVAVDSADNLYLALGSSTITLEPAGCQVSACLVSLGGGFGFATAVALDASGNVYVYDLKQQTPSVMPPNCASASCVTVLDSGLSHGSELALDASGNLYLSQRVIEIDPTTGQFVPGISTVKQFALATPPTVSFAATTADGSTDSTDGTQTVQVFNIGNAPLAFSAVSYPADFPEAAGDSAGCYSTLSLAPGAECDLPIQFTPSSGVTGALSEDVTPTDDALNQTAAARPARRKMLSALQTSMSWSLRSPTASSSSSLEWQGWAAHSPGEGRTNPDKGWLARQCLRHRERLSHGRFCRDRVFVDCRLFRQPVGVGIRSVAGLLRWWRRAFESGRASLWIDRQIDRQYGTLFARSSASEQG